MEYLIIGFVSALVAMLTLFSGFGVGTLLMPAFVLFFPVEVAVALTAVVHFLNNLFKLALFRKAVDRTIIVRFGIPAVLAAFGGAGLLLWLADLEPLLAYRLLGKEFAIIPVKLSIAFLIVVFELLEVVSSLRNISIPQKYLVWGGLLSGFFGGLSGHQGALRSAFLLRSGLSKEAYIGSSVVIACLVDLSRVAIYSTSRTFSTAGDHLPLFAVAVLSAFAGSFIGSRLLGKVTMRTVQRLVGIMLLGTALALGAGLI